MFVLQFKDYLLAVHPDMRIHKVPVGKKFGRWTVLSRSSSPVKPIHWQCRCDCGAEKIVNAANVKRGLSLSCGCNKNELARARATIHGEKTTTYSSKEYTIWMSMRGRCLNQNNTDYHRYGGRGITICARWSSFVNFIEDMGRCPDGFSLDRIDSDKGYDPDNCRWASKKTQSQNRECVKKYKHDGRELSLADWARLKGMNLSTMHSRIAYAGWSIQKAIETPLRGLAKQKSCP